MNRFGLMTLAGLLLGSGPTVASDAALVEFKIMSLETAQMAADATLAACRKQGYQVAVAVVDRFGNLQVVLKDRYAGPHTPDSARRKAWTAVSFRSTTSELATLTAPGSAQAGARDIEGALMLGGGIPVQAAGSVIGGIGVSGGPGGEADEACAREGLQAILSRIEL